jgi:NADPH:quinone reductase-like Zn-dependent oxidoreductase
VAPANLTFEQSAVVGDSALTALAGVRDQGKVQPGQRVLINGASGGVGTFAVQIAKAFGANVTGVCSTANLDMVRSIGADQVIDYTREDFVQASQRYDMMLDLVGSRSVRKCPLAGPFADRGDRSGRQDLNLRPPGPQHDRLGPAQLLKPVPVDPR